MANWDYVLSCDGPARVPKGAEPSSKMKIKLQLAWISGVTSVTAHSASCVRGRSVPVALPRWLDYTTDKAGVCSSRRSPSMEAICWGSDLSAVV